MHALPPLTAEEGNHAGVQAKEARKQAATLTRTHPLDAANSGFDVDTVIADTRAITRPGVRRGGSPQELEAANYILGRLRAVGFEPRVETFPLPNGLTSRNIIVVIPGSDPRRIVVGAHFDSKPPAPGANDDAVGDAALLELARGVLERPVVPTVEFDFFGTEEYIDTTPGHHHYGSRFRVASMSAAERDRIAGMMTLDLLAVGSQLHARTMGIGTMNMAKYVMASAKRAGVPMTYLRDPGSSGWADHEPFEKAGIPAVWIERLTDPAYHATGDTVAHLQRARLAETLAVADQALHGLTTADLEALRR